VESAPSQSAVRRLLTADTGSSTHADRRKEVLGRRANRGRVEWRLYEVLCVVPVLALVKLPTQRSRSSGRPQTYSHGSQLRGRSHRAGYLVLRSRGGRSLPRLPQPSAGRRSSVQGDNVGAPSKGRRLTLIITVATPRCIFQSADYRLTDLRTGATRDFTTQKVVFVSAFSWAACVCFAGVGRTLSGVDVSEWLQQITQAISPRDPFDVLLKALMSADDWLAGLPPPNNRHSFSVGAFVGSRPVVALISNFESLSGDARAIATESLSLQQLQPSGTMTFVSGHREALPREERRQLAKLAAHNPSTEGMYSALARANRRASGRSRYVSAACFTAHVRNTGEGGGSPQGTGDARLPSALAIPMQDVVKDLLDKQFGPGQWTSKGFAVGRSEATEEFHRTQLKEKPNDPNSHSNFGAYLADVKKDPVGAERAYRRALELDPTHINALGNLSNVLAARGELKAAEACYVLAVQAPGAGHENAAWNYANFLITHKDDRSAAMEILKRGITANPDSARLLIRLAEEAIIARRPGDALATLNTAREKNGNQEQVEACHAIALHLSGASTADCIAAYRTALALRPEDANLQLNLAQLLFLRGDAGQAESLLRASLRGDLDPSARLEGHVYLLCYCGVLPQVVARATRALLAEGGRLIWDVQANIEQVRQRDPRLALLASEFVKCMESGDDRGLDQAIDNCEQGNR
jgi:Flp pilus assembly protein TadD